jgi:hypothetical protein
MRFSNEDLVEVPCEGIHEFTIEVRQTVKVTLDGSKFDKKFMTDFVATFFPCFTLANHAEHIAQMAARDVLSESFTEGYGPLKDMGIAAVVEHVETEVLG